MAGGQTLENATQKLIQACDYSLFVFFLRSRDSAVGVRVPVGSRIFSMSSKTGSEAHPASYPMGIGGSFPRDKAAGV
jgi:hypothetical protein